MVGLEPTADMPSHICPHCGSVNDDVTAIVDGVVKPQYLPNEGDVGLCAYCSQTNVFTGVGLNCRKPTPDEFALQMQDPEIRQAIAMTMRVRRAIRVQSN